MELRLCKCTVGGARNARLSGACHGRSRDPGEVAHGIGQAMIATILGLGIAIPLLFLNTRLTAQSRVITQILDEQGHALLAPNAGGLEHAR